MREQMKALANTGVLSKFVGMVTDARSFLSYPRHEYFRRLPCDIIGTDVEAGKIPPSEIAIVARMVRHIPYTHPRNYFGF